MKAAVYAASAILALTAASASDAAVITGNYSLTSTFTSGPIASTTQSFSITYDPTVASTGNMLNSYSESTGSAALAGPVRFDVQTVGSGASLSFYNPLNGSGFSGGTNDFSAIFSVNSAGNVVAPTFSALSYSTTANGMIYDSASSFASGGPSGAGAVPEPATWAMMLLGFGMVAGVARNRRRISELVHA